MASTDYTPLPKPVVGNAGFLYPMQGWVAAGGLYFIDGHGVVRRLDPSGTVTTVATFTITLPQQLVSFVVRPDGKRLGAIIVTLPPLKNPMPANPLQDGFFQTGAHAYLDLEWADAGGVTATTLHKDLTADPMVFDLPTLLQGWDQMGPVAKLTTTIGTQDGVYGYPISGSALIHLAEDGTHLDRIGGSDCLPADELFNGTVICTDHTGYPALTVRSASGVTLWSVGGSSDTMCEGSRLSPAADRIACTFAIASSNGSRVNYSGLPSLAGRAEAAWPGGWLDNNWAVIVDANGNNGLGLVDAGNGAYRSVIDSGPAIFVGSVQS